jgi:hypothetical protein
MYKKYLCLLLVFLFGCNRESKDQPPVDITVEPKQHQVFILQLPKIGGATKKHGAVAVETIPVRWIKDGDANYIELIRNTDTKRFSSWGSGWFHDHYVIIDQLKKGERIIPTNKLPVSIKDNTISIQGCYYADEDGYVYEFKLDGTLKDHLKWQGTGKFGVGIGGVIPEDRRYAFNINWRLFPEGEKVPDDPQLLLITSDIISSEPEKTPEQIDEELIAETKFLNRVFKEENLPLVREYDFRVAKQYPESQRLQLNFFNGDHPREKFLYARDKILTDINWNEIDDMIDSLPKIFFAIDHIASLNEDKEVMDYLLRASFDDEGVIALENDFKSWVRIPTLFLLVYYNDWLTTKRVDKLSKVSNRIKLIVAEVKKYGNDSPNKLDEIMITVLSKLSDKERRDYFVKSLKLRNYVKESNNLSLQKLMPNDLPPPPGLPENMRDWYNGDGKLRRGEFLRLEDDPRRGKVLVLLDADRIELHLGFDDMSKETQRYITEMLEAQAEDAAEAQKNIDKPAQENK